VPAAGPVRARYPVPVQQRVIPDRLPVLVLPVLVGVIIRAGVLVPAWILVSSAIRVLAVSVPDPRLVRFPVSRRRLDAVLRRDG
jgi:hypothetical protein